jgi:hypothetical protein
MISSYIKITLRNPQKKLLQIINCITKVLGDKINIQKPISNVYTRTGQSQNEIKKIIPFTIASKG